VVVNQLNVIDLSSIKPKNNSPVGSDCNRPKASPVALQRMQVKARQAQILNGGGFVQMDEDGSNFVPHVGPYPCRIVLLKEPFQAPVPETDDHTIL
jgi:hypothetical protein